MFSTDFPDNRQLTRLLQLSLFLCLAVHAVSNAQPVLPAFKDSAVVAETKTLATATPTQPAKSATSQAIKPRKPLWSELTPMQQQALQPLAGTWGTINEAQKRKWLAVSKNYPSLPPEGQATMHGRMNEWVNLSPLQRAEARLNFATTKELSRQLTPEEKLAKWQTYQSLSADEKQKLADKASAKPSGAALAAKPVAPQKLAPVQPHASVSSARTDHLPKSESILKPVSAPVAPVPSH